MNQFPQPAVRLPHAAEPQRVSPGTVTMPQTMDRVINKPSPANQTGLVNVCLFVYHFWNRRAEGFNLLQPQLVRRNYDCVADELVALRGQAGNRMSILARRV
jgi:hypothetical protein